MLLADERLARAQNHGTWALEYELIFTVCQKGMMPLDLGPVMPFWQTVSELIIQIL